MLSRTKEDLNNHHAPPPPPHSHPPDPGTPATLAALGVLPAGVVTYRTSVAQTPSPGAPQAMPVSVASVEAVDIATWDEFSGRLEAVERVGARSGLALAGQGGG